MGLSATWRPRLFGKIRLQRSNMLPGSPNWSHSWDPCCPPFHSVSPLPHPQVESQRTQPVGFSIQGRDQEASWWKGWGCDVLPCPSAHSLTKCQTNKQDSRHHGLRGCRHVEPDTWIKTVSQWSSNLPNEEACVSFPGGRKLSTSGGRYEEFRKQNKAFL